MDKNIILTHTATLILSLIALFLMIFSFLIQNKKVALIMQVISFLCVLATVVYALLMGAELTEILVFILIFAVLGLISFMPKKEVKNSEIETATAEKDGTKENEKIEEKISDTDKAAEEIEHREGRGEL